MNRSNAQIYKFVTNWNGYEPNILRSWIKLSNRKIIIIDH